MHEHLTHAIYYFGVHLVYSSVVWLAAWALTSIPGGSATTKHWIWLATALNFILPVGALFDTLWAPLITWARPLSGIGQLGVAISDNESVAAVLCAVWLIGATLMLARLCARIATEHRSTQTVAGDDAFVPKRNLLAHGFLTHHRMARLTAAQPERLCLAANTLLMVVFSAVFLAGVFATVAHTACCFVSRT